MGRRTWWPPHHPAVDDPRGLLTDAQLALIDDVAFMVETGESLTVAARRLGRTPGGLEIALRRLDRRDLYRALAAREGDWNSPSNNEAVVRTDREQRAYDARRKSGAAA